MSRTLRLAKFLREAVHYDPVTREKYRFYERNKTLFKYAQRQDVFGSFTSILPQGRGDPRLFPPGKKEKKSLVQIDSKGGATFNNPERFAPKLGINPRTKYRTPIGIYSYPVGYILSRYNQITETFDVPFAGKQPYLHLFQVNGVMDQSKVLWFSNDDNQVLEERTTAIYGFQNNPNSLFEEVVEIIDRIDKLIREEARSFALVPDEYRRLHSYLDWEQTARFSTWYWGTWYPRFLERTGVPDLDDLSLESLILEKCGLGLEQIAQTWRVNFNKDLVESAALKYLSEDAVQSILFPRENDIKRLPPVARMSDGEYLQIRRKVLSERVNCDHAFIWNMTRHLAGKDPRQWTGLLRKLGYIGAVDHETGTIHPSEPTQAVFFDPRSIKVLPEVIHNEEPYKDSDSQQWSEYSREPTKNFSYVGDGLSQKLDALEASIQKGRAPHWGGRTPELLDSMTQSVGWLNQHASSYRYWSPEVRERLLRRLESIKNSGVGLGPSLSTTLNKMIMSIRRSLKVTAPTPQ